jgi:hypothetical protein
MRTRKSLKNMARLARFERATAWFVVISLNPILLF